MSLTAIIKSTGAQIVISDDIALAKQHKDELLCPFCDHPVIPVRDYFRMGVGVQGYTRHADIDGHYETEYRYHPESPEHRTAKAYLATNATELLGLSVAAHRYEVRMPEIKRIADVLIELDNGDCIVVEAQLSATTPEELEERTNDYTRLGYSVCWALGKDANKDYNYRWCLSQTGICLLLNFENNVGSNPQRRAA